MFLFGKNKSQELTDKELVERFRNSHDNQYLGILFERYSHLVFGLCMKYLKNEQKSKDEVINIFEKLIKEMKTHRVEHFKSWLYIVAKNHCLMQIREDNKVKKHTEEYKAVQQLEHNNSSIFGLSDTDKNEEKIIQLEKAMALLNEEQKKCIQLFYLEGKCYAEVAEATGYEIKKVKSYIQNGKRNLKIKMTQQDE